MVDIVRSLKAPFTVSCGSYFRFPAIRVLSTRTAILVVKREEKVSAHENSVKHRNCGSAWLARSNSNSTIHKEPVRHLVTQPVHWTDVLKRVVVVVKLLADRRLMFWGSEDAFLYSKICQLYGSASSHCPA